MHTDNENATPKFMPLSWRHRMNIELNQIGERWSIILILDNTVTLGDVWSYTIVTIIGTFELIPQVIQQDAPFNEHLRELMRSLTSIQSMS